MDWLEELKRAVVDAGPSAFATGRSAARLHGFVVGPPVVDVWKPADRELPGATTEPVRSVPCIDVASMLLLMTRYRSVEDITTAATTLGVALDALAQRAQQWLDGRGPNPREVRALLDHLDGAARPDSDLETRFLQVLGRAGLRSKATLHHPIELGDAARSVELDLAFVAQRVAVELDGWQYHRSRSSFRSDRDRDVHLAALGWVVLRFTHDDVTRRPAWVVDQLRRTVRARTAPATGDSPQP